MRVSKALTCLAMAMRSTIFTFPSRLASPRSVLVFSDEVVVSVGVVVVVVGSVSVGVVVVVVGSVSVGSAQRKIQRR